MSYYFTQLPHLTCYHSFPVSFPLPSPSSPLILILPFTYQSPPTTLPFISTNPYPPLYLPVSYHSLPFISNNTYPLLSLPSSILPLPSSVTSLPFPSSFTPFPLPLPSPFPCIFFPFQKYTSSLFPSSSPYIFHILSIPPFPRSLYVDWSSPGLLMRFIF